MLVVETIGRIRRQHFVKGQSIKEIARALKVSRHTVRKVLRSGATAFAYNRQVQPQRSWDDGVTLSTRCWRRTRRSRCASDCR